MSIFDDELAALKGTILRMGALVEEAIRESVRSLVERDNQAAQRVIDNDHIVNIADCVGWNELQLYN